MKTTVRKPIVLFAFILAACASPPPEPIDDAMLIRKLEARSRVSELNDALTFASLETRSFLPETWMSELTKPEGTTYWQACALAWEPQVRRARLELESSLRRADSAGYPGPIGASLRNADFDNADLSNEVVATFDLLGILGLGPTAAAVELAEAEVRFSFGNLEVAVWQATFEVQRRFVALATVRGELADLRQQVQEAVPGRHRAEVLLKSGRLASGPVSRIKTFTESLNVRVATLEAEEFRLISALAVTSGQLPDSQTLKAPQPNSLGDIVNEHRAVETIGTLTDLLQNHPELRRTRLEYAVAEAKVRRAAAEAWPKINIGPRFDIKPDDFLTGGVLRLSVPWPGSTDGLVKAAVADRTRSREKLEDTLIAVKARFEAARKSFLTLARTLRDNAAPAYQASRDTWQGLRAKFQIDESSWDLWTDALQLRRNATSQYWRIRRESLIAQIDVTQDGSQRGETH